MTRGQVRNRLIDSAQYECAARGVGATTIRGVIRRAGANLNAVHYHFGSREALIDAVADRALSGLNDARFREFDRLESDPRSHQLPRDAARRVLLAGYGPLFERTLGPNRADTREGVMVLGQLRNDPLGAKLPAMQSHGAEFVDRIETLITKALSCAKARLRTGMQLANAAAWDSALRPDVELRFDNSRAPAAMLRRFTHNFLDFAVGGLLATLD